VEIDDLSLALAVQGFSNALSLNFNLEANSGTSSAVTRRFGGHIPTCLRFFSKDGIIHLIGRSKDTIPAPAAKKPDSESV
jgi:hypothetical protein